MANPSFDVATNSSGTFTGDVTISHAAGTPRGALVLIVQNVGITDEVVGVTYGGAAMTRFADVTHISAETGRLYGYFLDNVAAGTQDVVIDVDLVGSAKAATIITINADGTLEIVDSDISVDSDSQADPSVTLQLGGKACLCALAGLSGHATTADVTALTNWSSTAKNDFGAQIGLRFRYNIIGTTDVTAGWTQTAEDAVMLAVAIGKVSSVGVTPPVTRGIGLAV